MPTRKEPARPVRPTIGSWLGATVLATLVAPTALANKISCELYRDSAGVTAWLHPKSFTDRAICPGKPECPGQLRTIRGLHNHPSNAIGPPSYRRGPRKRNPKRRIYSLGCRRSASWEFVDNVIVDVPGPDIFVFEVGPKKEPTSIDISVSGEAGSWINVGIVAGSKGSVDISNHVKPDQTFRFVRLTDMGSSCRGKYAGADIDAIAAAAYSWQRTIDASVSFPVAEWVLRDDAKKRLDRFFSAFPDLSNHRLRVTGHTDSDGTPEANLSLSINRAQAVKQYIVIKNYMRNDQIEAIGKGETQPIASNQTPAGRALNRRVELLFIPLSACPQNRQSGPRKSPDSPHQNTRTQRRR